jgi:hypothetical protein
VATSAHAKTTRPGLIVGSKATFAGLMSYAKVNLQALNQSSDVIMVTYYPLNPDFTVRDPSVVRTDIDAITVLYPGRQISLLEAGYPSSLVLNSSEARQREFIQKIFAAWDAHASQIRLISFTLLTDFSVAAVDDLASYYGIIDPNFKEYLLTLGLRTYAGAGTDKEAFIALQEEVNARRW